MEENEDNDLPDQADNSVKLVMLESWGVTRRGTKREENQDSFLNWPERMVWAVADGLGGSDHGAAASQLVIRYLLDLEQPASFTEHIENTKNQILEANAILFRQSQVGSTAATTLVCLLVHEGEAACIWSGDSRCYLLRGGMLYQCTKDHTLRQQKIDTGELTAIEAERMVKGNIVTNAIGVKNDDFLEEVRFTLHAGDRFLLCSDGLSGLLDSESISSLLSLPTSKRSVEGIMEQIADREQPDNITAVAVFLSGMI